MTAPKTTKTPTVKPPVTVTVGFTVFNVCRYIATMLLGAGKLGMLGALPAANLAHTSWLLVLAPAFFLELGFATLCVIVGLLAVAGFLLYFLWLALVRVVIYFKYRSRREQDVYGGRQRLDDARSRLRSQLANAGAPDIQRLMRDILKDKPKNE